MSIRRYFQQAGRKRIAMSLAGNLLIGVGVAGFKFSVLGSDPFNGMNMALANLLCLPYPVLQILVNLLLLCVQLIAARELIGFGTVVNMFLIGYICDGACRLLTLIFGSVRSLAAQLAVMLTGLLLCSLGLSLYQNARMGTAPYDALALILDKRLAGVPYFWCRMICDGSCTLICFLAGGIVGLGTASTVFGLGPMVALWDRFLGKLAVFQRERNT